LIKSKGLVMRLLIIGNLEGQFIAASKIAIERGSSVKQVGDIEKALNLLRNGDGADLILIHVKEEIARLCRALEEEHISVQVIACGIDNDPRAAVEAIKAGAKEYLPLPPEEELIASIFDAMTAENKTVIFHSGVMKEVTALAEQIAPSDATVLITGQSGTGKEVMARYIHQKSNRKQQPLICVNCAAIPDNLLESELFGHEKGAFTGAIAKRIGKFEEANNATLLLDEISEIDIRLQAKLLRAIQEREIDRIGGMKPIKLNIRIIATSNRDLRTEVEKGNFREDLYFRLNVINLHLPSLGERQDDILPIAEFYIDKYSNSNGIKRRNLSKKSKELLVSYPWPGNVRELENTMYRAILLASGEEIEPEHLKLPQPLHGKTLAEIERSHIISTLGHCLGNHVKAAEVLGISIKSLQQKINQYELEESN